MAADLPALATTPEHIDYRASPQGDDGMERDHWDGMHRWHPSIHMFRAFSRLTLTVTDVRVQRLQDITNVDAIAEGIEPMNDGFRDNLSEASQAVVAMNPSFTSLWNSINGPDAWGENPWVRAARLFGIAPVSFPPAPRPSKKSMGTTRLTSKNQFSGPWKGEKSRGFR